MPDVQTDDLALRPLAAFNNPAADIPAPVPALPPQPADPALRPLAAFNPDRGVTTFTPVPTWHAGDIPKALSVATASSLAAPLAEVTGQTETARQARAGAAATRATMTPGAEQTWPVWLAEQVPPAAAMMGPGLVAGAVGAPAAVVAGVGVGAGALIQGSGAVSSNKEAIENTPDEQLLNNPDYYEDRKIMSEAEAKAKLGSDEALKIGIPSAILGGVMGGTGAIEMSGVLGKLGIDKDILTALRGSGRGQGAVIGAGRGLVEQGVPGAAQEAVTKHVEAEEGVGPEATGQEIIAAGVGSGLFGAAIGGPSGFVHGTQTGGEVHVERTPTHGYIKPEAQKDYTGAPPKPPAAPPSPTELIVGPDAKAALDANAGKAPTLGVGEAQGETVVPPQPGAQPTGEAIAAPPAGATTTPPPPPPPAGEASAAPVAPPTVGPPVPETEATLRDQHAALLDPSNPRDAIIYNPGMQPYDIPNGVAGTFGKVKLPAPDGRIVQYRYDPNGRKITKGKVLEFAKKDAEGNDRLNELLQLGPVSQAEAVKQSVAGVGDPAVVTERAPPTVPGEPGVERKAAEGTTATAPAQVAALEATKTPDSTVQVETHQQAMAPRLKPEPEPAPIGAGSMGKMMLTQADKQALRNLGHSDEAISHMTPDEGARIIAAREGAATPRVEPTKLGETKFLSVWDKGDGTYFKRYADGRPDEPITKTVADLLTKQEAYKPQVSEAEKIRQAAQAAAPPPVRRILRSETEQERQAAAAQLAAQEKAAATEGPKIKVAKEPADVKEKRLGDEKKQKLLDINQVAREVANAPEHLPKDDETLAAAEAKGGEVTGARKRILDRATAMVKAARDKDYAFMRPLRDRVGETNHPNEGVLLHEAELLSRKKVPKTSDIRRFMYAENELRNNGEAGRKAVMDMRSQTGRDWAAAGAAPTVETAHEGVEGGEAKGIEPVEKPDVAEEMEKAKERVAEEKVAQEPGEERKETPLQKQAREASERAQAKLAERETPRERPTQESKSESAGEDKHWKDMLSEAHKDKAEGDVTIGEAGRYVSLEHAVNVAKAAIEDGTIKPWQAHLINTLGIWPKDVGRVLAEIKGAEAEAPRAAVGFKTATGFKVGEAGKRQKLEGVAPKINVGEKLKLKAKETEAERLERVLKESERQQGESIKKEQDLKAYKKELEAKKAAREAAKEEPPHLADVKETPTETVETQKFEGRGPIKVTPLRSTTAGEIIRKHLDLNKYSKELRPMISRLVDAVIRIAGDTPVHYLSDEEISKIHPSLRGSYDTHNDQIFLNADKLSHDTPLHELFHAATMKAIRENPQLGNLMDRLFGEMKDAYNRDTSPVPIETALKIEAAAFKNSNEFLTYLMTNEKVQDYFKRFKISDRLAKDIGIPLWRRSTLWNGLVDVIRQALKMEPRDTSAIEAAMAISEHLFMARDPRFAIEAATRLANDMPSHAFDVVERDQEAYLKTPNEVLSRVKAIDRQVATQHMKDIAGNTRSSLTGWGAKLMSGTWLNDVHGHLFEDAKGSILKAINLARDRVAQSYHDYRELDRSIMTRGYLLDRKYAASMADYGRLLAMSVRYNIHADRDLPAVKPVGKAARRDWQRDKYGPEVKALYDKLPKELQERYTAEKKFYADKQNEMARMVIDKSLPLFEPPKGSTLDEVMERARNNSLTEDDLAHYEDVGASAMLNRASRMMNRKNVYFYGDRSGDKLVTGHYEMPAGGSEKSYSGSELPENTREFDTEAQAHAYETGTHMPADTREAYYVKDGKGGYTDVYPKTPETIAAKIDGKKVRAVDADVTKYRVSLETQDTRFADTPAEALRHRAAMEAAGVKELSGVLDKHDERAWAQVNSAEQRSLERRIANKKGMTQTEKQHIIATTRQMMLSGRVPHFMERRDVAGGDYGTAEALDTYSRNINRHLARSKHDGALNDAMERLDAHETALRGDVANSDRRSTVANEMRDRVYKDPNMLAAKTSPLMQKLYTLSFIDYLARPSFVFLSQLHNWMYSVPMMAGRHGIWKAATGQRQAMKDLGGQLSNLGRGGKASMDVFKSMFEKDTDKAVALAHGWDAVKWMIGNLKDKDEKAFLTELNKDARFQTSFDASMFSGKGLDRTNVMMQQFTHAMEANNRLSAALNAYRLEKAMHGDHAGATAYANRVIEESHGVFSSTNIAPIWRNPVLRPFMQFHNQPMNMAMMLYRNAYKAFGKGEAAQEARWTLAYHLGTAMALGGMGGMPMDIPRMAALATQPLTGMGSNDYADVMQRELSELVGQTTANVIAQGLPGMMGPYGPSLGGRIGFDIGLFSAMLKGDTPDDMYALMGKTIGGAPASMLMDWLSAAQAAEKGDFQTMSEKAMPGALKDIAKAYRLATTGKYAGQQQIREASVTDAMRQLLGFAGAEEQRQTTGHYALHRSMQKESRGKGDLLTQYAQGRANQGDIAKWNAQNRDNRITPQEMNSARHPGRTTLGVKVTPKNRAKVREYEDAYQ